MAPRKQVVTLNGATTKGKAIIITEAPTIDQPHTTEDTGSSSQEAVARVQPRQQHDHRNERANKGANNPNLIMSGAGALDRENAIYEQETLRQLNNQL